MLLCVGGGEMRLLEVCLVDLRFLKARGVSIAIIVDMRCQEYKQDLADTHNQEKVTNFPFSFVIFSNRDLARIRHPHRSLFLIRENPRYVPHKVRIAFRNLYFFQK